MKKCSTQLLSYSHFYDFSTDPVADAFGIDSALKSILPSPAEIINEPSEKLLASLFEKIIHDAKVR